MEDKYLRGIIVATLAILIGLAFWSTIGGNVSTLTDVQTSAANQTFAPANSGTAKELGLCGQEVRTITVWNVTTNEVPASNYTITYANGADGYLSTFITSNNAAYNGASWRITCTYEADGYINESAGRSFAELILVFLAIAILASASPDLRDWIKG